MKRHIFTLTTCAFILVCGAAGASAEESTGDRSHEDYGMMGHGGMMGCGSGARRHDGWWRDDGARSRYALHLRSDG